MPMSANAPKQKPPAVKADGAAVPAADERDAAIQRLKQTLAEERELAATLREANEGFRFQLQILEKSYAKQLADARGRAETAERELFEKKARLAALDSGEDTSKLLREARADLAQITAERDELRAQVTLGSTFRGGAPRPRPRPVEEEVDGGTINALISESSWVQERRAAADGHLDAKVRAEPETTEDMIAPELVFTKGKDDDER
jgi:hypothetical protein